jgi:hypothetical protein
MITRWVFSWSLDGTALDEPSMMTFGTRPLFYKIGKKYLINLGVT